MGLGKIGRMRLLEGTRNLLLSCLVEWGLPDWERKKQTKIKPCVAQRVMEHKFKLGTWRRDVKKMKYFYELRIASGRVSFNICPYGNACSHLIDKSRSGDTATKGGHLVSEVCFFLARGLCSFITAGLIGSRLLSLSTWPGNRTNQASGAGLWESSSSDCWAGLLVCFWASPRLWVCFPVVAPESS